MPSARTILATALFVGTLDLSAALIQYYSRTGKAPFRPVLFFVASGLLGKSAYSSGDIMLLAEYWFTIALQPPLRPSSFYSLPNSRLPGNTGC